MDKTDSDSSEEFFDCQDNLSSHRLSISKASTSSSIGITQKEQDLSKTKTNEFKIKKTEPEIKVQQSSDDKNDEESTTPSTISPNLSIRHDQHTFIEPKPLGLSGRQRFRELRNSMQNDEDENLGNTLTPDSQNSSVDGVYASRPTHPFRIIENDTLSVQSMTSLGRVGRILAGNLDAGSVDRDSIHNSISSGGSQNVTPVPSVVNSQSTTPEYSMSKSCPTKASPETSSSSCGSTIPLVTNKIILQEPDVIASTKLAHSKTTDSIISSGPIAPPRRKKKSRKISSSSSEQFNMNDGLKIPPCEDDIISINSCKDDALQHRTESIKDYRREKEDSIPMKHHTIKRRDELVMKLEKTCNEMGLPSTSGIRAAQTLTTSSGTAVITTCVSKESASNRVSHSLGSSSNSVYTKTSPSNSAKSNSAPGRVSSINPNQGLNLYKVSQGVFVVKPSDDVTNKAEGPCNIEIEQASKIIIQNPMPRSKLAGTGSNSLGNDTRYSSNFGHQGSSLIATSSNAKERRKSAGDEDCLKQMNIYVRTRTDSGKRLTDMEILEQVPVKNLDTGENMPLSSVRPPPTPDGWNPLSLHIHKLYGHLPVNNQKESDEESVLGIPSNLEIQGPEEEEGETEDGNGTRLKKKAAKFRRIFGSTMRKTVDKAKLLASEVSHARHKEDVADIVDVMNPEQNIKIKASNSNKGPYEFAKLQHVQDLSGEHTGAVWCMKFSSCGRLLATAGQDKILRIWVLKDAYPFFQDMRTKYNADQKSSPTPSQESLVSQHSNNAFEQQQQQEASMAATAADKSSGPFMPKAFCSYNGHTSDLLDVSWSKNYFILSSSMDKTVRLWHISRKECLCCFQHIDFVTAIAFHPRDDRYFLSGSLDGKLRLWNIPDKKVALWNEVDGQTKLITAANFCQNGQFAVVGSYDGRCIFYNTDQLKYHTQINVRSTRGKNRIGRKISGIEPMPGEDKILVTSNDSRIRLYDLRDLNLSCKYKGYLNISSQIKASFSHDGKYIVAGSENQCIYIWKTNHDCAKLSSVRRDRSDFWEGIKAHNATVTCAIFAPHPEAIIKPEPDEISKEGNSKPDPLKEQRKKSCGYVLVSADFNGSIKVFINKTKPKHSSLPYSAIE